MSCYFPATPNQHFAEGGRGGTCFPRTLRSCPMETAQRIECQWCKSQNLPSARTCDTCGAPLDVRNLVSDSGWREVPRLRDMTEFHFGQSSCQVEGEIVPVAEIALGQGDWVYFEHHVMLWKDESVAMSVMSLQV